MYPISQHYEPATRTLSNPQGDKKVLSPQCARLLTLLIDTPSGIVTREQMRRAIWKHNVVSEDLINHLVSRLRKEITSLPGPNPWQIEVIPKVGYRLLEQQEPHDLKYWLHRASDWFGNLR